MEKKFKDTRKNLITLDQPKSSDSKENTEKLNSFKEIFGILKGLSPEKSKIFDEAVKRRPVFK